MTITSMKMESGDSYTSCEPNPYGYGLCINLTEDQVEALGLQVNPPKAGSKVGIRGIAFVRSVTTDADLDGDGDGIDVTLSLQVTDLEVTPEGSGTQTDAATLLYGGD